MPLSGAKLASPVSLALSSPAPRRSTEMVEMATGLLADSKIERFPSANVKNRGFQPPGVIAQ